MPETTPDSEEQPTLREQMERKGDKPSAIAPARSQGIEVRHADYYAVRDVVDARLRRKLAGEFPYNVLEREIEVSTSTFWKEQLVAVVVAEAQTRVEPEAVESIVSQFIEAVGEHPAIWNTFNTPEEVLGRFLQFLDEQE